MTDGQQLPCRPMPTARTDCWQLMHCNIMGRDGEMATDQIRTIDKRRLKNRIATLTADETESLQDVLRQMFCE